MQGIIIANSDAERHPEWGNDRHWDALYIPELKVIIDWIQEAKLGGRIIDKLQWLVKELPGFGIPVDNHGKEPV